MKLYSMMMIVNCTSYQNAAATAEADGDEADRYGVVSTNYSSSKISKNPFLKQKKQEILETLETF